MAKDSKMGSECNPDWGEYSLSAGERFALIGLRIPLRARSCRVTKICVRVDIQLEVGYYHLSTEMAGLYRGMVRPNAGSHRATYGVVHLGLGLSRGSRNPNRARGASRFGVERGALRIGADLY